MVLYASAAYFIVHYFIIIGRAIVACNRLSVLG